MTTTHPSLHRPPQAEAPPDGVFARIDGHEQVVYCTDAASGLRAIIAIHSTTLGPALGGTRFYPYADERAALGDVLALARGMSYKAAVTGLALGGGKAVIIGDPAVDKTDGLLRAYGRFVQSLSGRYYTACDVGTFSRDMDIISTACDYVTGRTEGAGGAGDSSVLTAYGVLQGMKATSQLAWGTSSLRGRRVGVAGVGKVGRHLVSHLVREGASVVLSDVSQTAIADVLRDHPEVEVAPDSDALIGLDLDVYAPCALGGALDDRTVELLSARVVCGAANNQLAHRGVDWALDERGILYAPDYVVNAGGLIQVEDELHGFSFERARRKAEAIYDTTLEVFGLAAEHRIPAAAAADRLAEIRMGVT